MESIKVWNMFFSDTLVLAFAFSTKHKVQDKEMSRFAGVFLQTNVLYYLNT